MVNNNELRATLQTVIARLDAAEKHNSDDWMAMGAALLESANYASKCATMRRELEKKQRAKIQATYGAWREAERNASGQRGGGRDSEHARNVVREAAKAYVVACENYGNRPGDDAIEAAKDPS